MDRISLCEQGRADDAGFILKLSRNDLALQFQQGHEFFMLFADPAADDKQIGPEEFLHLLQIGIQALCIFFPRKIVALADCVGSANGETCVEEFGTCGCSVDDDCQDQNGGSICFDGICGCNDVGNCDGDPVFGGTTFVCEERP